MQRYNVDSLLYQTVFFVIFCLMALSWWGAV
jgi:hypothetical protein